MMDMVGVEVGRVLVRSALDEHRGHAKRRHGAGVGRKNLRTEVVDAGSLRAKVLCGYQDCAERHHPSVAAGGSSPDLARCA